MSDTPNSSNIWQEQANTFWPGNTTSQRNLITPGLYKYCTTPQGEWYLERTGNSYQFGYKIYGAESEPIIARIQKAWKHLDSNLGILLNGIKGTGKTVTAQLLANWAIEEGIMVLNIRNPIPLATVLEKIEQPVMVVFDEFEKTHAKSEHQQSLLTAIDGMARNRYKRMFVFTTNSKNVDSNFVDRPSRIRYLWEFGRLDNAIVEEIMDDLLDSKLERFRSDISLYLNSRAILSIDVVKTVINEVNIFEERPSDFEKVINLSEQNARGFIIEAIDSKGKVIKVLNDYFILNFHGAKRLRKWLLPGGPKLFMDKYVANEDTVEFEAQFSNGCIELIKPTANPSEWIVSWKVNAFKTWVGKIPGLTQLNVHDNFWLDDKPEGWKIPEWTRKIESKEELTEEEELKKKNFRYQSSIYGGQAKEFMVRITPLFEEKAYNFANPNAC